MKQQVEQTLKPVKDQLLSHPVYGRLKTLDDMRIFMEEHMYAVWDFMSLLKALQQHITCVDVPWIPSPYASLGRFINEIVLGEESDLNEEGVPMSHFEMYLEAMEETGADTRGMHLFIKELKNGKAVTEALEAASPLPSTTEFVRHTFEVIDTGKPHLIAASFTYGREELIPEMFLAIIDRAGKEGRSAYPKLTYYLERHIELDGDEHGPLALKMISELCGDDNDKWQEVITTARQAIEVRIRLWDGVMEKLGG
ncbi:DUF3050 domain-containing protein [Roseivirga sp. BDSF3-8]|uniref:DUF3050 domain-containing protein n=1 Tax=Roseivirga sp. BDSF3-8 TaxID=3241598 RepID=UPI003532388C